LPHGSDAGVPSKGNSGLLLCSDLFHQVGDEAARLSDGSLATMAGEQSARGALFAHPVDYRGGDLVKPTRSASKRRCSSAPNARTCAIWREDELIVTRLRLVVSRRNEVE
jgi:hypothetical protein